MDIRNIIKWAIGTSTIIILSFPVYGRVYVDEDKFSGTKFEDVGSWTGKYTNTLKGRAFEGGLSITPGRVTTKESQTYVLRVRWSGGGWIFIGRNTKLILLVDGEKIELVSLAGSTNDRETNYSQYSSGVTELAAFPATKEIIEKITTAKKVEIALYADKGRIERTFRKSNFKPFKEFIDKVVYPKKETPKNNDDTEF